MHGGGMNGLGGGVFGIPGAGGGAITGTLPGAGGNTGIGGLAGAAGLGGQSGTIGGLGGGPVGGPFGLGVYLVRDLFAIVIFLTLFS